MKIYKPKKQPPTVNINIKQQGSSTEHISGILGSLDDVILETADTLRKSGRFDIIAKGKVVTVEFREYIDGKNGQSNSFKMYSTTPKQVKEVIIKALTN